MESVPVSFWGHIGFPGQLQPSVTLWPQFSTFAVAESLGKLLEQMPLKNTNSPLIFFSSLPKYWVPHLVPGTPSFLVLFSCLG